MKLSEIYKDVPEPCKKVKITGITADSRKVKENYAFVAISGEKADGHDYIASAISNGATLIISDKELMLDVPVFTHESPRQVLVDVLSRLYPLRPEKMFAVTGTNGKTSVADFIRQILNNHGRKAVSVGTLGAIGTDIPFQGNHTTPDPELLYPFIQLLAENGVTDFIIEASSHGLAQKRLSGLKFDCVLFTNFTRDHMDYHKTETDYFNAKASLFSHHTHKTTKAIVFDDDPKADAIIKVLAKQSIDAITFGYKGRKLDYKIKNFSAHSKGADFTFITKTKEEIDLSSHLLGQFQTNNMMMAMIACHSVHNISLFQDNLSALKSVDGRLDYITSYHDAAFYVDYAHTPDALEKALTSLRSHCSGRLVCLFGCGGNRDMGKRSLMAEKAAEHADYVVVTDDNPRFEEATDIRQQIIAGFPEGFNHFQEIANREEAIKWVIQNAQPNDIILVAGKGHENGQVIGDNVLPFKDAEMLRKHMKDVQPSHDVLEVQEVSQEVEAVPYDTIRKPRMRTLQIREDMIDNNDILWTQTGITAATGGSILKPFNITGVSIDSRDVKKGDLFIALKARRDGHYFIRNAAYLGASAALASWKPKNAPRGFPLVYVKNTLSALEGIAVAARSRTLAKIVAVTGTVGKTTVKSMLSSVLSYYGKTHASSKSLNNHLGVPLTLARMPQDSAFGVFEIGMNKPNEITPLVEMVRPDVAVITTVGEGHREFFNSLKDIALAKAEIMNGLQEGGTIILNADISMFELLKEIAVEKRLNIITFGKTDSADIRLLSCDVSEDKAFCSNIHVSVYGQSFHFMAGLQGEHNALNICCVIAVLKAMTLDVTEACTIFSQFKPVAGRGEILELDIPQVGYVTIVDESYNANPLSMKAALQNMTLLKPQEAGLKILVIGTMKELGEITLQAHIDLKDDIIAGQYDAIYLIGKEMIPLYEALGEEQPAVVAENLSDVLDEIVSGVVNGSVMMIKGSNSTHLWQLVERFKKLGNQQIDDIPYDANDGNDDIFESNVTAFDDTQEELDEEINETIDKQDTKQAS